MIKAHIAASKVLMEDELDGAVSRNNKCISKGLTEHNRHVDGNAVVDVTERLQKTNI
jgi:hypothetical protein